MPAVERQVLVEFFAATGPQLIVSSGSEDGFRRQLVGLPVAILFGLTSVFTQTARKRAPHAPFIEEAAEYVDAEPFVLIGGWSSTENRRRLGIGGR